MARAAGNLGVWGSLVLLGLCGCCAVVRAAETSVVADGLAPASLYEFSEWEEKDRVGSSTQPLNDSTVPNPVGNLTVEAQNTSSISLVWEHPDGPSMDTFTYWAQCIGSGGKNGTQNTRDTRVTVDGLDPGSSYECSVWVERDGLSSSRETVSVSTVPNPVRNLTVEAQNTSSISLVWEHPDGPSMDTFTYWAQCIGSGGNNGTQSTTGINVTVDGLDPGSSYECSVWVERDGLSSSRETVYVSTAPAAVNSISCVSTSGGYGVILTWSCPSGGYEAFEVEVGSQWSSVDGSVCEKGMPVSDLGPAQSYTATITTVSNGLRERSVSVICYTESTGVIVGTIVGILLLFILVGLLIFFLKKRKKSQQKEAPKDLVFRNHSIPPDASEPVYEEIS